jgi:hypothetical protein
MKSIISISILISMAFMGCQNESVSTPATDEFNYTKPNPNQLYSLHAMDPSQPYERIDLGAIADASQHTTRNPNEHAQGHFTGGTPTHPEDDRFYQSISIDFNALKNSQGVSGFANFTIIWGENGEYVWQLNASAEELAVEENEAIYCGFVNSESGERPFDLEGSRIWFRVIDEGGQGNNSNTDRYYDDLLFTNSPRVRCEVFSHESYIWQTMNQREVEYANDRIKVN